MASADSHTCPTCGKRFTEIYKLISHTGAVDEADRRPHKCDQCDEVFCSLAAVHNHRGVHRRIFPCHVCNKAVVSQESLEKHYLTKKHARKVRLHELGLTKLPYNRAKTLSSLMTQKTAASAGTDKSPGRDVAGAKYTDPLSDSVSEVRSDAAENQDPLSDSTSEGLGGAAEIQDALSEPKSSYPGDAAAIQEGLFHSQSANGRGGQERDEDSSDEDTPIGDEDSSDEDSSIGDEDSSDEDSSIGDEDSSDEDTSIGDEDSSDEDSSIDDEDSSDADTPTDVEDSSDEDTPIDDEAGLLSIGPNRHYGNPTPTSQTAASRTKDPGTSQTAPGPIPIHDPTSSAGLHPAEEPLMWLSDSDDEGGIML